jgi:hypothetical protein
VLKWQTDQISNTHVVYTDRKHVFIWGKEYYALMCTLNPKLSFEQVKKEVPTKPASPKENIDNDKQWNVRMWYYDDEDDKGVFYQHIYSSRPSEYGLHHIPPQTPRSSHDIVCNISYEFNELNDKTNQEWAPKLVQGFNNLQKEISKNNLKTVQNFVAYINSKEFPLEEKYITKESKVVDEIPYLVSNKVQDKTIIQWCRNYIYYWCITNRKDLKVEMPDVKLVSNGTWRISQIPERCARYAFYKYPPARGEFVANSEPLEQASEYIGKFYEINDNSILNQYFTIDSWVKVATGYEENVWTDLVKEKNNTLWSVEGNRVKLIQQNGTPIDTGGMFLLTIDELRKNILYKYKQTAKFQLIEIIQPNDSNSRPNPADIKLIMSNKKQAEGGMFQAASQFNALECKNDQTSSYNPRFFTMYKDDGTQGPTLSLTAIYSAIARRDCIYIKDDKKSQYEKPLNYLSEVKDKNGNSYFNVNNGYFQSYGVSKEEFPKDSKTLENLRGKVKVVFQKDIPIIHDTRARPFHEVMGLTERFEAHQVFTAAMDISQSTGKYAMGKGPQATSDPYQKFKPYVPDENDLRCVDFVLDAAYESSYLAAHYCGAKTLWLTLVGGGVFGNPIENILKAINVNHERWGRGLSVIVCDFEGKLVHDKNGKLMMKPKKKTKT